MPATGDAPCQLLVAEGRCGRWKRGQVGDPNGRCRQWVRPKGSACRLHGGPSLKGAAHPRYTTGEASKYMPARMMDDYERAANDPDRFSFEKGVAAMLTLAADRWKALAEHHSEERWRAAADAMRRMRQAHDAGDDRGAALALAQVESALSEGWSDVQAELQLRHELVNLYDKHRKLVQAEVRRQHNERVVLTAGQVVLLQQRILDLLSRRVLSLPGGRDALTGLQVDFQREATRWDSDDPLERN